MPTFTLTKGGSRHRIQALASATSHLSLPSNIHPQKYTHHVFFTCRLLDVNRLAWLHFDFVLRSQPRSDQIARNQQTQSYETPPDPSQRAASSANASLVNHIFAPKSQVTGFCVPSLKDSRKVTLDSILGLDCLQLHLARQQPPHRNFLNNPYLNLEPSVTC
jgi:hypothetical protein